MKPSCILATIKKSKVPFACEILYWKRSSLYYLWLILGLRQANDRRRYFVTTSLIGWAQTWNQPCYDSWGAIGSKWETAPHYTCQTCCRQMLVAELEWWLISPADRQVASSKNDNLTHWPPGDPPVICEILFSNLSLRLIFWAMPVKCPSPPSAAYMRQWTG